VVVAAAAEVMAPLVISATVTGLSRAGELTIN
jgi:hypothetical protein